ncbi:MAG: chromate resistance protein [Acetobacteraceae bacterium]
MTTPNSITSAQLSRLIGLPDAPVIIEGRIDDDHVRDPRSLPGAVRKNLKAASTWASEFPGRRVAIVCQRGEKLSQGAAAWLRHEGVHAESLEGGFEAWVAASGALVRPEMVPPRDDRGRTIWVTRARPKVDRIACPWLIRRFVDPSAVFLFVTPAEVELVADRFGGTPFDVDGVFWSHRGELCTFDAMLEEFGLHSPALDRLALIVRGADTACPDLAPEAPGLLAASLGLSRMYSDDLAQLAAGLALYDAFYRWARDASDETHNWPACHVASRPAKEAAA